MPRSTWDQNRYNNNRRENRAQSTHTERMAIYQQELQTRETNGHQADRQEDRRTSNALHYSTTHQNDQVQDSHQCIEVDFNVTASQLKEKLNWCVNHDEDDTASMSCSVSTVSEDSTDHPPSDSPPTFGDTNEADGNDPVPYGEEAGTPTSIQKESMFFDDVHKSPAKAVLLFYINSGLFRFDQYKDYCAACDGQQIDIEKLKAEIRDEQLSDKEYDTIIRRFYEYHSFTDFTTKSCAACGLRCIERPEQPRIAYTSVSLAHSKMAVLRYTEKQTDELLHFMESPEAFVTIPINEQWEEKTINLTQARSFYAETTEDKKIFWHLHPELVDVERDGTKSVCLCPVCHDDVVTKGSIPKLSIANGIDFGYYERLGLVAPNLHEQLILARTRLYFAMLKVSSNAKGQVNWNELNKARCHAILFPHNSSEVASFLYGTNIFGEGGLLNKQELRKLIHLYMVDPNGRPDAMAREVFGTVNLLARSFVVAQWLIVLRWCNPFYKDLDVSGVNQAIQTVIEETKESILNNAIPIDDPDALEFEKTLGSDVAQVRNVEATEKNDIDERHRNFDRANHCPPHSFNDISYSYITNSDNAYHSEDQADFRVQALQKLADLPVDQQVCDEDINDCLFDEDDVTAYLHQFPPTMHGMTARGTMPLDDFERDDRGISTSFPHVFMLGSAYKRAPGNLSRDQRFHLLNQFHLTPAKDRRLLGFLFDIRQRKQVISGVKAHVEGNKDSVKVIRKLLNETTGERKRLQFAAKFPHTKKAKKTLRRYLSHLKFSSKDISYGVLEGTKLKHRLLGTSYRYSAPTCFLTISPGTIDNPRSIRLAVKTRNNREFPSVFEESCPYGADGNEFADNMASQDDYAILSEATINFPRSKRAEMAIENPVAFVQEYKTLLNDIISILLGVNIEDGGYYSKLDSKSARKTSYYKFSKGIFGHTFSLSGVTEAHEKGTLHWHFTIYAGLSPYVLQRFAHLQEICDEIAKVLDTMYVSEVPADLQAGGLLRRFIKSKKNTWGISDDVTASIDPPEMLLDRKDPTETLSVPVTNVQLDQEPQEHPRQEFTEEPTEMDFSDSCSVGNGAFSIDSNDANRLGQQQPALTVNETYGGDLQSDTQASVSSGNSSMTTDGDSLSLLYCQHEPIDFTHFVSIKKVNRVVAYQGTCRNYHCHQMTCHKGSQGKIGCRLCCPVATCESTGPIKLLPRTDVPRDNGADQEDRPRIWSTATPDDPWDDQGTPKHHLKNILDNNLEDSVIVWETKRPVILSPEFSVNPMDECDPKQFILQTFQTFLADVPAFGAQNEVFWTWMYQTATVDQLHDMFLHIKESLPASNGFIASFNPVLALCTGSHNNASLLGSLGQAKSALFYLIPYQGKTKFPLMASLTIMDHAINHIGKYKSKAIDSGTMIRTAKHLLTRVINRIHLQIEISDYQVAASLLELPSMIMSDRFEWGSPLALSAFRAHMEINDYNDAELENLSNQMLQNRNGQQQQPPLPRTSVQEMQGWMVDDLDENHQPVEHDTNDENVDVESPELAPDQGNQPTQAPRTQDQSYPTPTDLLHGLGYISKLYKELPDKKNNIAGQAVLLPKTSLYLYRGDDLRELTYYEYIACCRYVNKKPRVTSSLHPRSLKHFCMNENFIASTTSHHVLGMKLHTPLLVGQVPRHPGKRPTSMTSKQGQAWKAKADFYAKYYLSLFRPEDITSRLGYQWQDLEQYVTDLQNDSAIISKFRLMIMHQHMSGMKTTETVKKMTLQYRGRSRDLWTHKQRMAYERWNIHREHMTDIRTPMNERFLPTTLPQATINNMFRRLSHDAQQVQAFTAAHVQPREENTPIPLVSSTVEELLLRYDDMINWRNPEQDENPLSATTGSTFHTTRCEQERLIFDIRSRLDTRPPGEMNQQLNLFDTYSNTFMGKSTSSTRCPKIALIHGPPGVGKSHVRKAISEAAAIFGKFNDNTAFNSINAIDMKGGQTTCMSTGFNCQLHFNRIGTFLPTTIKNARDQLGTHAPQDALVNIDEVGTQAPPHLARKSALCKLLCDSNLQFGGREALLYGDLTQLGPVKAGLNLTQAVMDIFASQSIRTKIVMPGKKKKQSKTTTSNTSLLSGDPKHSPTHPYYLGAKILTSARWFELTQQQRSIDDPQHSDLINRLYKGMPVTQMDIKQKYKILDLDETAQEEWINAPVIVATNREHLTMIEERSQLFAKLHGTHVICWQRESKDWEQKPPDAFVPQAQDDAIFWEHFVVNGMGFLNETIQRRLYLVNALPVRYHAIKFERDLEVLFQFLLRTTPVGHVIDMPKPPQSVIVEVFLPDDVDPVAVEALREMSLERPKRQRNGDITHRILIPVTERGCSWDSTPTVIRGSACFLPSRARFRNRFPIELGFSITVHKSQGKTLRRIIIALSSCGVNNCNFSFQQLLVAFSRVRDGDHIRLLLVGNREEDKWGSITFINDLKRDPSIAYFFAGFREPDISDMNKGWIQDVWNQERANKRFEEMIDQGLF